MFVPCVVLERINKYRRLALDVDVPIVLRFFSSSKPCCGRFILKPRICVVHLYQAG